MWKPAKSYEEIEKLYEDLALKYGHMSIEGTNFHDAFDNLFFSLIQEEGIDERDRVMPTDLMQMYSELGIMPDLDNPYIAHLKKISENFDLGRNVLEVAGGIFPALSNIIARRQLELCRGTITMYDPCLFTTEPKYPNLKLCKEEFNYLVDVKDFDLIIGIMSCGITEDIITSACENNKDFYIAMCGCPAETMFGRYMFPIPEYEFNVPYAKRLCEEYNNGDLIIDYLDDKYDIPFPIIYNKRK